MDKWQTWCMHRIEDPEKVIRFHSCPHMKQKNLKVENPAKFFQKEFFTSE
jgi:hypothetical protein